MQRAPTLDTRLDGKHPPGLEVKFHSKCVAGEVGGGGTKGGAVMPSACASTMEAGLAIVPVPHCA